MSPGRSDPKAAHQLEKDTMYDSDVEPPDNERLNWRLDPSDGYSDWTIEITSQQQTTDDDSNKERKTVDTYHVHKNILSVGSRKSEYFSRLFQNGSFAEAQNQTSRIELEAIAAKAFPKLLDHVYSQESALCIDTFSATALHYLGEYFEMRRLRWEAKQFWRKDLSLQTCGTYYEHASIFQDEKILQAVASVCADNALSMDSTASILKAARPEFWLEVLKLSTISDDFSLHVSNLTATICANNKNMGSDLFNQLTDARYLPNIPVSAAYQLIELEEDIVGTGSQLSSLQSRCIESLSNNWEDVNISDEQTISFLRKPNRNPLLLAELYSQTLMKANSTLTKANRQKKELENQLTNERTKANSALKNANTQKKELEHQLASERTKVQAFFNRLVKTRNMPFRIKVEGAGTSSVNSIFELKGWERNVCKYGKTDDDTYYIVRGGSTGNQNLWDLYCSSSPTSPLYHALCNSGDKNAAISPEGVWLVGNGRHPAPSITYL